MKLIDKGQTKSQFKKTLLHRKQFFYRKASNPQDSSKSLTSQPNNDSISTSMNSKKRKLGSFQSLNAADDYQFGPLKKSIKTNRQTSLKFMSGRRINYWSYDNSAKSSILKAKKDEKLSQNDENKKTLTYSTNIRLLEQQMSKYKIQYQQTHRRVQKVEAQRQEKRKVMELQRMMFMQIIQNLKKQMCRNSSVMKSNSLQTSSGEYRGEYGLFH